MRLIIINVLSARQGGGVTNVMNLLTQLSSQNIKVLVLTNSENHQYFQSFHSSNIKYFNSKWPSKGLLHRMFWDFFYINRIILKFNASIYYNPGGTLLAHTPPTCIGITTVQNMLPFSPEERKRYPLTNFLRYKLFFLKFIYIYSYRNADKIIFPSNYSYKRVTKYVYLKKVIYTIIPNGVNEIFYQNVNSKNGPNVLKEKNYYLYVSTFDFYKAQLEIVREWDNLVKQGIRFRLILIGHSSNNYKKKVLKLIHKLQLENFVLLLNPVAHAELPSIYANSRALIFASSCECGPNILSEMMASRKLIFCSSFEPMPEFGLDSVTYFNPYIKNNLVEKIVDAEKNGQVVNSHLAEKALKYVQEYKVSNSTSLLVKFVLGQ